MVTDFFNKSWWSVASTVFNLSILSYLPHSHDVITSSFQFRQFLDTTGTFVSKDTTAYDYLRQPTLRYFTSSLCIPPVPRRFSFFFYFFFLRRNLQRRRLSERYCPAFQFFVLISQFLLCLLSCVLYLSTCAGKFSLKSFYNIIV
jgi:hypothetical protein